MNRFDRGAGQRVIRSEHHGFYLYNARGDVVQRANAAGVVTHSYRYTAFGNELAGNQSANETSTNPWRYAGEYWDAHRGEYYLRARSFNPRLGRFTQPDPFWNIRNMQRSTAAITQAGNLFMYTMHNPVMWVDPSGLFIIPGQTHLAPGLVTSGILAIIAATVAAIKGSQSSGSSSTSSSSGSRPSSSTVAPTAPTTPVAPPPASSATGSAATRAATAATAGSATVRTQVSAPRTQQSAPNPIGRPATVAHSRNEAFRQAKMDANVSMVQQPIKIEYAKMKEDGRTVMHDGQPVMTRQYHFVNKRGERVIIQDHGYGHRNYGLGPHFNVRPIENPNTGKVPGTHGHYFFDSPH